MPHPEMTEKLSECHDLHSIDVCGCARSTTTKVVGRDGERLFLEITAKTQCCKEHDEDVIECKHGVTVHDMAVVQTTRLCVASAVAGVLAGWIAHWLVTM